MRPKKKIDWDEVDSYLNAQCNGTEIAGIIGMHPNTLYNQCKEKYNITFTDYSRQKKNQGIEMLKAKQYNMAMNGNTSMAIWLGKQHLNQSENGIKEVDKDNSKLEIIVNYES